MAQPLVGKVALITGAARGQGRCHALRLAGEGAAIIATDLCEQIPSVPYPLADEADLAETARAVESSGGRIVTVRADVRDPSAMDDVVAQGIAQFGRLDIVVANAGVVMIGDQSSDQMTPYLDTIAVNLHGVRNTVHAAAPTLIEQGDGGSIVLISSTQGLTGRGGDGSGAQDGYTASKHAVVGLMRSWANWLAPHRIRVNSVHPTGVNTPMVVNDAFQKHLASTSGLQDAMTNLLPVGMVEPEDVASAVAWLARDESRYVTGVTLPVDAGFTAG